MGFYFRKSFGLGPVKLNLSKSGLGLSFGVKGARVSVGPKGTAIHAGRGGVYYRKTLGTRRQPSSSPSASHSVASAELTRIGAAPSHSMSEDFLLEELRRCNARVAAMPWVIAAGVTAVGLLIALVVPIDPLYWTFVALAAILTAAGAFFSRRWDRRRLCLVVNYQLSNQASQIFGALNNVLRRCASCDRLWSLTGSGITTDWKRNAGANRLVERGPAVLSVKFPRRFVTEQAVYCLSANTGQVHFLPDRVLFYSSKRIHSFTYEEVFADCSESQFIEHEGAPADAKVVSQTWQYVNKDGSPDRRFANNFEIPVCLYGRLHLTTASGMEVLIQTSRADVPRQIAAALAAMRSVQPRDVPDDDPEDTQLTVGV